MQSSNIPPKIPLPFANAAGGSYVNTIPVNSQIGITNGRASLADGFPPLTFTPIASGGVPPFGSDMNGILKEITTIQQWQEAGGFFLYDSSFSTTIGGYPKGAILQSSNFNGLWVSAIENNTNNPDTTGTGWISLSFEGAQSIALSATTTTLSFLQAAYPILTFTGTLTANSTVIVPDQAGEWIVVNNTTGAYTLTVRTASGTGVAVLQNYSTYIYSDGTNVGYANSAAVNSFNGRTGTVTLNATDVTNALGYTPVQYAIGASAQSWQNVLSSRSAGVTYTNSTSYPIWVTISIFVQGISQSGTTLQVNGQDFQNVFQNTAGTNSGIAASFNALIQPGSTYQLKNANMTILLWWELRN